MHAHDRTLLSRLGFADPDKRDPLHDLACQYLALAENHERLARLVAQVAWQTEQRHLGYCRNPLLSEGEPYEECEFRYTSSIESLVLGHPSLEFPISKGDGRFRTTIGFLDAWLPFSCQEARSGKVQAWTLTRYADIRLPVTNGFHYRCDPSTLLPSERSVRRNELPEALRARAPAPLIFPCKREGEEDIVRVPQYERVWKAEERKSSFDGAVAVEVKVASAGIGDVLRQISLYREYVQPTSPTPFWVLATPFAINATDSKTLRDARIVPIRLGPKFDEWCAARASESPQAGGAPEF